jgi:hypothetical protein
MPHKTGQMIILDVGRDNGMGRDFYEVVIVDALQSWALRLIRDCILKDSLP